MKFVYIHMCIMYISSGIYSHVSARSFRYNNHMTSEFTNPLSSVGLVENTDKSTTEHTLEKRKNKTKSLQ